MTLAKENARTASKREQIEQAATNGISLYDPILMVALGGLKRDAKMGSLTASSFKNVKWGGGGDTYGWRHRMYRSIANRSTGELRVRSVEQPDLYAKPTISRYMLDRTFGVGEGDLETNRHAGPFKIRDIKRDRVEDAVDAIYAAMAAEWWNINETGKNGGLTMFSPTAAADGTTSYAGILMNASTTNGTDTFEYWHPNGYDYTTNALSTNLLRNLGMIKRQMTYSQRAGGQGKIESPDFGVYDPTLEDVILAYYQSKASFNINAGATPANMNLFQEQFQNYVIMGITLFPSDNFGGSTGYIDAVALEEIMIGYSNRMFLSTTHTKEEGLIKIVSPGPDQEAWLAGQMGVVKTGMNAQGFRDPRCFQILYT